MKNFKEHVETSFGLYEGVTVPLEQPMIEIDEYTTKSGNTLRDPRKGEYKGRDVELNEPKRSSDKKKYVVYVRNPKTGNIMKIYFGDEKGGLTSKINDPAAARAFASRHKCDMKRDKTKPGYWACRLPRYAKQLGLKGGGNYFW